MTVRAETRGQRKFPQSCSHLREILRPEELSQRKKERKNIPGRWNHLVKVSRKERRKSLSHALVWVKGDVCAKRVNREAEDAGRGLAKKTSKS